MKKLFFVLIILFFNNSNIQSFAFNSLNNLTCENLLTKSKTNIVYSKNFAKEEMSPNIWLFFQIIKLENNNLNIISLDDEKHIREWKINLISGEATLVPMFDPVSKWSCKI